jgi:3-hydroxyacyl-CoA dehydrogenase
MQAVSRAPIAIVGAGSIGVAFAIVFTRAGHPVRLYDPDAQMRAAAPATLHARATDLTAAGLLDETADALVARLQVTDDLAKAVDGVAMVIECAPERVELKQALFTELDRLAPPEAILASASSALPASRYAGELPGRGRCLVAHPGNPPYLIPVIEIVPAPFTDPAAADRAQALFAAAGMLPIRVGKEVEGFVFNRLQGAILREAYCLVRDGVASVADIDTVVREGLGMRWSLIGPFETVDLNTRGGIASHAQKMGPAYERMGAERGQHDPWTAELVAEVDGQRRAQLPLADWEARVAWRDRALMQLVAARRKQPAD